MGFNKTEKSGKGTFVRRLGEGAIQWSAFVKETSPGVYPQLVQGQLVSLDATSGEIIPTASTQTTPIGTVLVVNDDRNGQKATVMLNAVATIRTSSAGVLTYGQYVSTVGVSSDDLPISTAIGSEEWATGITLGTATGADEEVIVAVLPCPVLLP